MTQLTAQDVNKYITTIRINFENAYKTQNDEEREILIKSWFAILKEYPKEIVDKAVINAIKYSEFAPRIGTIVKEIEKMRTAYEKSDGELWAELTDCIHNVRGYQIFAMHDYIYENGKRVSPREEVTRLYNSLAPELKDFVGGVENLKSLALQDTLEFEKGRFIRTMPTIKQRTRTRSETPANLAGLIQGLSLAIECDGTKLLQGE